MQWQLIPETTMHAFDINALLTMIAINKLTDQTGADRKRTQFFSPQCKNNQCGSKNTHAAVSEKLTINFFWTRGVVFHEEAILVVFYYNRGGLVVVVKCMILDLLLPMQSVPITTNVSSNPARGEVYLIQH